MTYVLALQQPSRTAIIADCRITRRAQERQGADGANVGLKAGVFFPGCTYAAVGDVQEAREFLVMFKETVRHDAIPSETWARFRRYVQDYAYPPVARSFQVILSSRCEGSPQLAVVESGVGLRSLPAEKGFALYTFGSGTSLLDRIVEQTLWPRVNDTHRFMTQTSRMPEDSALSLWPFHLCLWLSELSLTFEASLLEEHGVGGVFHFVSQTALTEAPQGPALYVMTSMDDQRKRILCWSYRIVGVAGGLFVERHDPPHDDGPERVHRYALFDRSNRLDLSLYSTEDLKRLVLEEQSKLPFYTFAGVGSDKPETRRGHAFTCADAGQERDVFEKNGDPTPAFSQLVRYYHQGPPDGLEWTRSPLQENERRSIRPAPCSMDEPQD